MKLDHIFGVLALVLFATSLYAQQKPEDLSATERTAVASIGEKYVAEQKTIEDAQAKEKELGQLLKSVEADIAKNHPGFVFDERTGNLKAQEAPKGK